MRYSIISIALFCVLFVFHAATAQQTLNCKVKEGCTAEECLDGTEFPVLCKGKGNQAEFFKLFVMLAGQRKQMEKMQIDMAELREFDETKDNVTDDILLELEKLEETNKNQVEINKQLSNETQELREENGRLNKELNKLKAEFEELKQKLSSGDVEFKSPGPERKSAIDDEIYNETETTPETPETTTETPVTTTAEPEPDNLCMYRNKDGVCYWVKSHGTEQMNYAQAVAVCEDKGSSIAQIMWEEDFEAIMSMLRREMAIWREVDGAWFGMTIDPLTSEVTPKGAYQQWYRWFYPRTGESYAHWTHVNLLVNRSPLRYQGMTNDPPSATVNGVVCQNNDNGANVPEMMNEEIKKRG